MNLVWGHTAFWSMSGLLRWSMSNPPVEPRTFRNHPYELCISSWKNEWTITSRIVFVLVEQATVFCFKTFQGKQQKKAHAHQVEYLHNIISLIVLDVHLHGKTVNTSWHYTRAPLRGGFPCICVFIRGISIFRLSHWTHCNPRRNLRQCSILYNVMQH